MQRLRADEPQAVSYCIPLPLRDLQIESAIRRVPGRIQPAYEPRSEPCAVVCFGPSLIDTWEEVRNFKYIFSCSGSHKFLADRQIVPTFHVEVDPRPHKVQLIGSPSPETTYLIASTCHPKLFDHLEGMQVLLWHVFDAKEEGLRLLPHGEWALTGGCDVGSRAITIAGFFGFRDVHVFGMDGCQRAGVAHAAAHPNEPPVRSVTVYDDVEYHTTPSLLEAARQVWHELDEMPLVRATFHGEGLVQAMARRYQQKTTNDARPFENVVGFQKPAVISSEYRALNAQLHDSNLLYGIGGGKHADVVRKLAEKLQTTSILDYGCGKGFLAKALPFPIWEYDPAIPGKDASPRPADIVACTDVLEHIEPEHIRPVLADLRRCTRQVAYFVIHTGPSSKTLADGRNSHVLQHDRAWWTKKLKRFFAIGKVIEQGPLLTFVAAPRALVKSKPERQPPPSIGVPV